MEGVPENQPSHQKNPRDERRFFRKIEATRIEDIEHGIFGDFNDEDWDQEMVDEAEAYAEEAGDEEESLSYDPFDAREALRNIRKLSAEEQALSKAEKRDLRRERMTRLHEALLHQKEGIAKTIGDLRMAVESNPDENAESLMQRVKTLAQEYKFTRYQIALFQFAAEKYQEKHVAVEKYHVLYPNDADFFEACFGQKPKGKIEIIKGPMTILFRCYSEEDYGVMLSTSRAQDSAGVALRHSRIEELAGTITGENVTRSSPVLERRFIKKIEEVHNQGIELDVREGDIEIEIRGIGKWQVKIVDRDNFGYPRVQLLDLNIPNAPPLFDLTCVEATDEMRAFGFVRVYKDIQGKFLQNEIKYLRMNNREYGVINIDPWSVKIEDRSPEGMAVTHEETEYAIVPGQAGNESVRIHEDQHQFNKLFLPLEWRESILGMMRRVSKEAKNPEDAVQKLIYGLVRLERRYIGIDGHARDEILAHYKDGQWSISQIYQNLTEREGYDYKKWYQEEIAKIPEQVKKTLEEEISETFYVEAEDVGEYDPVDARALSIDASEVEPYIKKVFIDDYKADLKTWLDAISDLEQKGYTRDEIVSVFSQEPINSWSNLARRMQSRTVV